MPNSTKAPELRPVCEAHPGILILTAAAPAQRCDSMTAGKTEEGEKKKKKSRQRLSQLQVFTEEPHMLTLS